MDLKESIHNKSRILHLIDSATRYTAACLINSKHKDTIMQKIFQIWIAYFGCPKKVLNDNGGEFPTMCFIKCMKNCMWLHVLLQVNLRLPMKLLNDIIR